MSSAPTTRLRHDYLGRQFQAIGKVPALKGGEGGYVAYDVFGIR